MPEESPLRHLGKRQCQRHGTPLYTLLFSGHHRRALDEARHPTWPSAGGRLRQALRRQAAPEKHYLGLVGLEHFRHLFCQGLLAIHRDAYHPPAGSSYRIRLLAQVGVIAH